jgi:hypothetical protein
MFMALTSLAFLQFQGCSGGGGGGGVTASTGTLKVALTDKTSDEFSSVWIKVKAVKVVPVNGNQDAADDDPALIDIPLDPTLPSLSFNVLTLAYIQQLLGIAVLPAGTYSQVRLILEPNINGQDPVNYVTLGDDPTKIPLKTPSGQQSGLKVIGSFMVQPGVINAIALDFDPNTAIVERGNSQQDDKYILNPTGIRIIQMEDILPTYGTIAGTVLSTFKDWSSATVSVKSRGGINDIDPIAAGKIFSNYTSGAWQAPFTSFVPGSTVTYKTFVSANGFSLYSSPAVTITTGQTTDLGSINLF